MSDDKAPFEHEGLLFPGDELDDKLDRDIDDDFESERMMQIMDEDPAP